MMNSLFGTVEKVASFVGSKNLVKNFTIRTLKNLQEKNPTCLILLPQQKGIILLEFGSP